MSRPKVHGDRVQTAIRLDRELHTRLTNAAEERDVSVNFLIHHAVRDLLDNLIPVEELRLTRRGEQ